MRKTLMIAIAVAAALATAAIVALAERIQRTRRGSIRKALTVLS